MAARCPIQLHAQASGGPLSPRRAPLLKTPNFPSEVCARPGPGHSSARPPNRRREGKRKKTVKSKDPAREPARKGERKTNERRGLSEGSQWPGARRGRGRGRRPSGYAAPRTRQVPGPARVLPARRPGASYLGCRADWLRLRVPAVLGQRGAGEGEGRGGRGPGREAYGARAPLAPRGTRPLRHICSSGQGRWPRRPGCAGMSLQGREERRGGRGWEEGLAALEEGEEEGRGGRPPSLPPSRLARSLPPSLQTPLTTAAPGPERQLPDGACAGGGGWGWGEAGPGEGRRADGRRSGHRREGGAKEGAPPRQRRASSSTPPPPIPACRGPAPSPRAALGQGLGGGGQGEISRPWGKPGRGAGEPARRKSPKDREDGGGRSGRGAGTLASPCGVTLARAPAALGCRGGDRNASWKALISPPSPDPGPRRQRPFNSDRFEATLLSSSFALSSASVALLVK